MKPISSSPYFQNCHFKEAASSAKWLFCFLSGCKTQMKANRLVCSLVWSLIIERVGMKPVEKSLRQGRFAFCQHRRGGGGGETERERKFPSWLEPIRFRFSRDSFSTRANSSPQVRQWAEPLITFPVHQAAVSCLRPTSASLEPNCSNQQQISFIFNYYYFLLNSLKV